LSLGMIFSEFSASRGLNSVTTAIDASLARRR
jgi:hypothetical protein